jgi:hypothetical protein
MHAAKLLQFHLDPVWLRCHLETQTDRLAVDSAILAHAEIETRCVWWFVPEQQPVPVCTLGAAVLVVVAVGVAMAMAVAAVMLQPQVVTMG